MSEVGMEEKESPLKYLYVRWRQKKQGIETHIQGTKGWRRKEEILKGRKKM